MNEEINIYNRRIEFKNHQPFFVFTENEYHEQQVYKEVDSLTHFLQLPIVLEEGTLFDDIWFYIEKDANLLEIIFSKALGGHQLHPFIDEFKKPAQSRENEDINDSMHYLYISWEAEVTKFQDEKTFYLNCNFDGYGYYRDQVNNKIHEMGYGIELTPINDLKSYELKLDNYVKIYYHDLDNNNNSSLFRSVVEGYRPFTVYDILYAILDEVTFFGNPEQKQKQIEEIQNIAEQSKEDIEQGNYIIRQISRTA